jgi:hypothetical protein
MGLIALPTRLSATASSSTEPDSVAPAMHSTNGRPLRILVVDDNRAGAPAVAMLKGSVLSLRRWCPQQGPPTVLPLLADFRGDDQVPRERMNKGWL